MKTLDEIRLEGLEALRERLGRAGMVRFLQQFEGGRSDYARERREWVDKTSLDDLREIAESDESHEVIIDPRTGKVFNPETGKYDLREAAKPD